MEKIFSHAWRGRHGCETKEELEQLQERQTTPEEIQGQFIDDDQVSSYGEVFAVFTKTIPRNGAIETHEWIYRVKSIGDRP